MGFPFFERDKMRNIEIKAKVKNVSELVNRAKQLSQSNGEIINQSDSFYNVRKGRLKLRKLDAGNAQLIYYDRPDMEGPKPSSYEKCEISKENVMGIHSVLCAALGSKSTVNKIRNLFLVGQTRIHIDSVEKLGDFMELEVVLDSHQSDAEGEKIAFDLMEKLGIERSDLVSGAYEDFLNK